MGGNTLGAGSMGNSMGEGFILHQELRGKKGSGRKARESDGSMTTNRYKVKL